MRCGITVRGDKIKQGGQTQGKSDGDSQKQKRDETKKE